MIKHDSTTVALNDENQIQKLITEIDNSQQLLTNATVVDDAIRFVTGQTKKENPKFTASDEEEFKEPDYGEKPKRDKRKIQASYLKKRYQHLQ